MIDLSVVSITRGRISETQQTLTCTLIRKDCFYHTLSWMKEDSVQIASPWAKCSVTLTSSHHDLTNKVTCQVTSGGDVKLSMIVLPGDVKAVTQTSEPPPDAPIGPPPESKTHQTSTHPAHATTTPSSPSSCYPQSAADHLYVGATVVRVSVTVVIFLMLLAVIVTSRRIATKTPTIDPNAVIDD